SSAVTLARFEDTFFSRENRYSLGMDRKSGSFYLAIPASSGVVYYVEYYRLGEADYGTFCSVAAGFADECRRRDHDDLLIQKPGWNRGAAI
ncbi:hypothetical protein GOARA_032_00010, partial [Gordonia araii NBRC 100433]